MSMTYHDQVFLAPLARRARPASKQKITLKRPPNPAEQNDFGYHGIGRSPRFAPGWWLAATALFYVLVALLCIFAL
jgi:hypothetical protein